MSPKLIDLTQIIEPTDVGAERKFVVNIHNALHEVEGKVRPEGEWYIMSDVELMNHVGTHIETPFHCLKDGADLSQIALDQLCGEAVILDLRQAEAEFGVTLAQVQAAATAAGGILPETSSSGRWAKRATSPPKGCAGSWSRGSSSWASIPAVWNCRTTPPTPTSTTCSSSAPASR
ncbi:MAG: cyclase family protein [Caldilineaceae bacterium]